MPDIEFIYDHDCPNVDGARLALREALRLSGLRAQWREWDRADSSAPAHALQYGSPTVLVNGRDIAGAPPAAAPSCRIYTDAAGHGRGVPTVDSIRAALGRVSRANNGRRGLVSALPAIGVALLPKLTCAACWPAYAALLGAMGISFVDYTPWLLPIMGALLGLALVSIAWRAGPRRGFGPFWLGAGASIAILAGKFGNDSDIMVYAGTAILFAAAVWNVWPRRHALTPSCPACETANSTTNPGTKP